MQPSQQILSFIASFEKFVAKPYLDAADIPTIGYGATLYPSGKKVTMQDKAITEPTAMGYMLHHISTRITPHIPTGLPQNEFDALVSFVYNVGSGAFNSSTLKKKVLAQAPCQDIRAEFMRWNKAGGKVLAGLTKRRQREADIFCLDDYNNHE